jgi:hypothetical protein
MAALSSGRCSTPKARDRKKVRRLLHVRAQRADLVDDQDRVIGRRVAAPADLP